jgi:hypothetical protein
MALTLSFSHFPGLLPGLSKRKAFGLKDQLLRNFKRCNLGDSRSPFGLMFHRWFGIKTRQENEGKKLFPALHLHASIFMPQSSCLNLHAPIFMPQSFVVSWQINRTQLDTRLIFPRSIFLPHKKLGSSLITL